MDLSGIISISGKPGLYKIVGQTKNGIIVEGVDDGKRFPAYASHRISALEDISIYTADDDIPLSKVYRTIFEKENGGACIDHKSNGDELKAYLESVLPDFDEERVYTSDIKKMMSWYNTLQAKEMLKLSKEDGEETAEEAPEATAEEAPEAAVEEAPEAAVEEAPEAAVEEAPEAAVEEAPEAAVEEAPEAAAEEAPEEDKEAEA